MLMWIILGLLITLTVGVVLLYNMLVAKRALVDNGWSDIEVQLKRRADLIPRLVETVKGYASHERETFERVIAARNAALGAGNDVGKRGQAEGAVSAGTGRLFALAEAYPELKANENFLDLQNELSETETKIEMARRFYNGAARELNTAVETFPTLIVAGPLGFGKRPFFEISAADAQVPDVEF